MQFRKPLTVCYCKPPSTVSLKRPPTCASSEVTQLHGDVSAMPACKNVRRSKQSRGRWLAGVARSYITNQPIDFGQYSLHNTHRLFPHFFGGKKVCLMKQKVRYAGEAMDKCNK